MVDPAEPLLDLERVLFLDRRNRKFVEKATSLTARARDAQQLLFGIFLLLLFAAGILSVAVSTYRLDSQLVKSGRVTTGVITAKTMFKTFCKVTYRFSGPGIYEGQTELPYDACSTLAVGQAVNVTYDPQQPLYSNLGRAIAKPRFPIWFAVPFLLTVVVAMSSQFIKVRRERRMCAEGQVICGSLVRKNIENGTLTMQYRFRAPAGYTIGSEAKGLLGKSNWSYDSQFFPDKPNLVAVLCVNETEFYAL